ncbi:histidinol-phosphate transaminase [Variovorax sp. VRV01]|uniref:histidinol-phosphate transaminase n=1 Tax=Variovorax sp. VRV01 TaxID=2769259 RepID=UPI0017827ED6|nr:histidinol-phosphate transaminase [Variovorax sp. VRV01]MBD9668477.1 histidinol-phosphate transaminase [Variovorax sp. VRV01]
MTATPIYPAHIASLKPYVPGLPISDLAARLGFEENEIVKLASNENLLGASPKALAALASAAIDISRYPDSDCAALVKAIAQFHDISPEWVVVGAGSESVLGNIAATILEGGRKSAYSAYSFQAYVNAAKRMGAVPIVVPSPDLKVDLGGLERALGENPSLVYIANPGNPTGTVLEPDELESFLSRMPAHVVVILDEAYFEFVGPQLRGDSVHWVRRFPNLVVLRTFSKAYGLAGLRVGYGIAQPALADMLRRVRSPFTVTHTAQVAAIAALDDQEFLSRTIEMNGRVRQMLVKGLTSLGIQSLESHTNFVLAKAGQGAAFARRLEKHGLIVRPVDSYGLPEWVRISVGTESEVERLLHAIHVELAT